MEDKFRRFHIHQTGDVEAETTHNSRQTGKGRNSQKYNKRNFPKLKKHTDFKIERSQTSGQELVKRNI